MKFARLRNIFHFPQPTRARATKRRPADRWLLGAALILSLFGLLMVYDASVAIAIRDFADQYYFLKEQVRWLVVGGIFLFILSRFDYHRFLPLVLWILLGALLLLIAVFIPGIGVAAKGARRWIDLGGGVFQPAEFAKLALALYLSAWFANREKGRTGAFLLLLFMVVGLVVAEPDLGTAMIILGMSVCLYFISGAPLWQFGLLVPALGLSVLILAVTSPYRFDRIQTFLNPDRDPLGASYQIRQILLALGSGGWTGIGVGQSRQKYEYLPEANTDSIFAIVGEELGFVGASAIVLLFLCLIWRGFRIAKRAPDLFGRYLAAGISSWIGVQVGINLAANVALVPLTGIPLPLVSYGGSSLVVTLCALGILLNISRQGVRS